MSGVMGGGGGLGASLGAGLGGGVSAQHLTAALQQNGGAGAHQGRITPSSLPLDNKVTVKVRGPLSSRK